MKIVISYNPIEEVYKVNNKTSNSPDMDKKEFFHELHSLMNKTNSSIQSEIFIGGQKVDLFDLYSAVMKRGGYAKVTDNNLWEDVTKEIKLPITTNRSTHIKSKYNQLLFPYEKKNVTKNIPSCSKTLDTSSDKIDILKQHIAKIYEVLEKKKESQKKAQESNLLKRKNIGQSSNPTKKPHLAEANKQLLEPQIEVTRKSKSPASKKIHPNKQNRKLLEREIEISESQSTNKKLNPPPDRSFSALYNIDSNPERKKFLDEMKEFCKKNEIQIEILPTHQSSIPDLYTLHNLVVNEGGEEQVTNKSLWPKIAKEMNLTSNAVEYFLRKTYNQFLSGFERATNTLPTSHLQEGSSPDIVPSPAPKIQHRRQSIYRSDESRIEMLYEIDDSPERKKFLDEVSVIWKKEGISLSNLPIRANKLLDLYKLYLLVVDEGGVLTVITSKKWRKIMDKLHIINTSGATYLREQYMTYIYQFECEKHDFSMLSEVQAEIDKRKRSYTPASTSQKSSNSKHLRSSITSNKSSNIDSTDDEMRFPEQQTVKQHESSRAKVLSVINLDNITPESQTIVSNSHGGESTSMLILNPRIVLEDISQTQKNGQKTIINSTESARSNDKQSLDVSCSLGDTEMTSVGNISNVRTSYVSSLENVLIEQARNHLDILKLVIDQTSTNAETHQIENYVQMMKTQFENSSKLLDFLWMNKFSELAASARSTTDPKDMIEGSECEQAAKKNFLDESFSQVPIIESSDCTNEAEESNVNLQTEESSEDLGESETEYVIPSTSKFDTNDYLHKEIAEQLEIEANKQIFHKIEERCPRNLEDEIHPSGNRIDQDNQIFEKDCSQNLEDPENKLYPTSLISPKGPPVESVFIKEEPLEMEVQTIEEGNNTCENNAKIKDEILSPPKANEYCKKDHFKKIEKKTLENALTTSNESEGKEKSCTIGENCLPSFNYTPSSKRLESLNEGITMIHVLKSPSEQSVTGNSSCSKTTPEKSQHKSPPENSSFSNLITPNESAVDVRNSPSRVKTPENNAPHRKITTTPDISTTNHSSPDLLPKTPDISTTNHSSSRRSASPDLLPRTMSDVREKSPANYEVLSQFSMIDQDLAAICGLPENKDHEADLTHEKVPYLESNDSLIKVLCPDNTSEEKNCKISDNSHEKPNVLTGKILVRKLLSLQSKTPSPEVTSTNTSLEVSMKSKSSQEKEAFVVSTPQKTASNLDHILRDVQHTREELNFQGEFLNLDSNWKTLQQGKEPPTKACPQKNNSTSTISSLDNMLKEIPKRNCGISNNSHEKEVMEISQQIDEVSSLTNNLSLAQQTTKPENENSKKSPEIYSEVCKTPNPTEESEEHLQKIRENREIRYFAKSKGLLKAEDPSDSSKDSRNSNPEDSKSAIFPSSGIIEILDSDEEADELMFVGAVKGKIFSVVKTEKKDDQYKFLKVVGEGSETMPAMLSSSSEQDT